MKQAILLLSNRTDYAVRERYDKLIKDYGCKADVYLLFDVTKGYNKQELVCFEHVYPFDVNRMIDDGYTALKEGFLGNCHYPILMFYKEYQEYDYFWIVEDDVIFSGNWSTLFDSFTDDSSDLVATKIRSYEDEPTWCWWRSIGAGEGITLNRNAMYACFIPIYRLSAKAIECLDFLIILWVCCSKNKLIISFGVWEESLVENATIWSFFSGTLDRKSVV